MSDILFIYECKADYLGGIQGKILAIARSLKAEGHLAPALLTMREDSRFAQAFAAMGAPVVATPMRGPGGMRRAIRVAEAFLSTRDCRVIQSHMFRESILGRHLQRRHPQLKHVFRVHTHLDGRIPDMLRRVPFRILDRMTRHHVDRFVPISEAVSRELRQKSGVSADRITVVHNGIPALGTAATDRGGAQPLVPEIAVIGDLQARKQPLAAVAALGELRERGVHATLHLVGADREGLTPRLLGAARANGCQDEVRLHGYLDRAATAAVVQRCSIVMLPSLFEGMPTAIIEGMSMRKVVIASAVGATAELVVDGVNGFLHAPRDVTALATILERVLRQPARDWDPMRDAAFRTWREQFSEPIMMAGLTQVYRDLGVLPAKGAT